MKMRSFWCLLFVVSLPADSFREEKKAEEVIGTLGENVTFHLKMSGPFTSMSWLQVTNSKYNHIAVVKTGQPCFFEVFFPKLKGRLTVSSDCRDLQITNLHQDDSGEYKAQIEEYEEEFRLEIYNSFREEKKAEEAIRTVGESVTFHLKTSKQFKFITWLQGTRNGISNIAIVEAGQPCHVENQIPKSEGRLNVSRDCRSLQITNLHQDDSGEYQAQIKDHKEYFRLEIYRNLSESDLEVQCEIDTLGDGNYTWFQLKCSAGKWGERVNYSWTSPSKDEKISSQVVQREFQDGDANYTCTAENPVSKASKTVSIKEACKGNAMDFGNGQLPYEFPGVTIAAVMIVVKVIVNIVFVVSVKCFSGTKPRDTPRRRGESVVFGRSRR